MPLIRHTRLSVMPITKAHYETMLELSEKPAPEKTKAKKK
jgi:predicted RNA-binding protein with PUA-like domain